jgi:hypothetical protein
MNDGESFEPARACPYSRSGSCNRTTLRPPVALGVAQINVGEERMVEVEFIRDGMAADWKRELRLVYSGRAT